jgi:hypothetical protein
LPFSSDVFIGKPYFMLIHRSFGFASLFCGVVIAGSAHAQAGTTVSPDASARPAAAGPPPPAPPASGTSTTPYYQAVPAPEAQPPAPTGAPPATRPTMNPTIYVEQPPLPPLEPRNRHFHDGFYLRLSAGLGGMWVNSSTDFGNGKTSGAGAALDLMIGGTPAPGLVIGGGVLLQEALNPSSSVASRASDFRLDRGSSGSIGFGMLGPMIDVFPNPTSGFHFGGLVGLSSLGLKDKDDKTSVGAGLSAWAGYMWWTSSQWSLGGMLRFTGAWSTRQVATSGAETDVTDTTRALTLLFSAAYH